MKRLWSGMWVWYHRTRIERLMFRLDHHERQATFHGRIREWTRRPA